MNKKGVNKWILFFALLIGIILIYFLFNKYGLSYLESNATGGSKTFENILIFIVVIILSSLFIKFSSQLLKSYLIGNGEKRDVKLVLSVYKYFMWIFILFITFSLLFKQVGSLITSLGLIGFGITFALQKPLLNFVGWLTIVFNKTYKLGDVVSINNINGRVYDVKVMYTNVSELDNIGDPTGKSISIPNEFVLTSPVANFTKGTNYIWDEIAIYLTYQSNWKKAQKIAEKIVQDYYDKNIKKELKKTFKEEFKAQNEIVSRINLNEKGVILRFRYLVDFNVANETKGAMVKILLDKLKSKDIIFGKIENIKAD
ncbi:mechanosensitive ion channel [Candidatus Pacearchaeota archaeon]|nr:mechanosensitive ion channel [Candidatus Pacearchaeota archaeon]MBI2057123.1 mechanosensitive ion channel [Candidatus Pacearchaeota archaeon]